MVNIKTELSTHQNKQMGSEGNYLSLVYGPHGQVYQCRPNDLNDCIPFMILLQCHIVFPFELVTFSLIFS